MSDLYELEWTRYGFRWGPLYVSRSVSDIRGGVQVALATTPKPWDDLKTLYVRASPGGRVLEAYDSNNRRLLGTCALCAAVEALEAAEKGDGDGD